MDTITKQLAETLRELLAAGDDTVTAEDGIAAMIRFGEANDEARAILAAYDAQPLQQARQPLTQVSIEKLFCTRIDIRHDEFTAAMPDTFRQGQWFRRGWQAAQEYFGITGEQP